MSIFQNLSSGCGLQHQEGVICTVRMYMDINIWYMTPHALGRWSKAPLSHVVKGPTTTGRYSYLRKSIHIDRSTLSNTATLMSTNQSIHQSGLSILYIPCLLRERDRALKVGTHGVWYLASDTGNRRLAKAVTLTCTAVTAASEEYRNAAPVEAFETLCQSDT